MMMLVRSCMGTPLPRVTSRNDNDNDDDAMINDNDNDNDNDDGDGDNDNATLSTQLLSTAPQTASKKTNISCRRAFLFISIQI